MTKIKMNDLLANKTVAAKEQTAFDPAALLGLLSEKDIDAKIVNNVLVVNGGGGAPIVSGRKAIDHVRALGQLAVGYLIPLWNDDETEIVGFMHNRNGGKPTLYVSNESNGLYLNRLVANAFGNYERSRFFNMRHQRMMEGKFIALVNVLTGKVKVSLDKAMELFAAACKTAASEDPLAAYLAEHDLAAKQAASARSVERKEGNVLAEYSEEIANHLSHLGEYFYARKDDVYFGGEVLDTGFQKNLVASGFKVSYGNRAHTAFLKRREADKAVIAESLS